MSKRPETAKFAIVALLLLVLSAGCSVKKSCSADSQCDEGSFCSSDGECVEFKEDDYALVFEGLSDGQTVTSADDADKSKDGTQIDIAVTVNDSAGVVKDGTSMSLSVTAEGKTSVIYFGTTVKDRVIFSLVTIPFGEVTLKANLVNNPSLAAQIKISSKNIDIELYYLKNGENGSKTVLQNATVKDDDDLDKITSNGLQISVSASTTGLKQGDYIKIFMPEIQEELISEAVIDEKGEAQFGTVNVPIISKVRLTVVSGDYSENMEFSVDSQQHCGFLTNLENDMILGSINDKNENVSDLQYDLVVSDIAGCGDGSTISVYIDKDPGEGVTPDSTFETASNMAQERITFEKSKTANDKRKVVVVIEDAAKSIKGSSEFSGILVDLDAPLAETSFPEAGQTLNMSDDIDSATPGLQVKFAGTASDDLTPPVTVYVKLDDTIISEQSVSDGDFEVEYSFNQSYTTMMLYVVAIDGAGNSVESNTPFSVNIDTQLKFIHVCGREGSVLIDGAWLNHSADLDTMENLQCKAVLQVSEESGADQISLKVGDGATVTKTVNGDNEAEFDLSLADTDSGILLNATAYINGTSAGQNSMTFRVDTIPPVVTLSNDLLLNNGETTSSVDITFGFECSESYCEYNSWLDSELTNTYDISASRDVTGLASGGHVFKVRATDAAGNTGDQTVFNWTVDNAAPETTITTDPGEGSTNDFAFFTFESSKNGSSFQCRLEKDGAYFMPSDGSWEDCNSGSRDYFGLENGSYRFFVRAEDSLGNIDPSPAEHAWIIGTEAPETLITGSVPSSPVTNITSMDITFEADMESTFSCRLLKDGLVEYDWTACDSGSMSYTALSDGSYIFEVKATAVYGVQETSPASYSWVIDTVSPKVMITSKPSKFTPYDSGTFVFECSGESDKCSFYCEFDDAAVDCSTGYYSFAAIGEGNHRFTIEATDKAGNKSVTVTDNDDPYLNDYSWVVNYELLGVTITVKPPSSSPDSDASFEFESNKAASFECKMDDGDYATCSSPENYSGLSEGDHTFTVKAVFAEETAFESYTWTVDTTDPVINIVTAPESPTNETGATFVISVSEPANLECKLSTESEWSACSSPLIYTEGTFGTADSEQSYTLEIRAVDQAGNTGTASHSWTVDLIVPTIEWVSPAFDSEGKIYTGKADNVFVNDPVNYAINITVKVSGSNTGQPINVSGFKTPPGYTIINVDTDSSKNYVLTVGLQNGARVNNPLTISVSDNAGSTASVSKIVIVNTETPNITWASPSNGYKFVYGTGAPVFVFNVWNAQAGTTVELVDSDTSSIVGTAVTTGSSGIQEYVYIYPSLTDRCTPYKLYATFVDAVDSVRYYTNATSDTALKTSRSFSIDTVKPVIDSVVISGISDTDRILNRADNLNVDPEGGMKTDMTVSASDPGNGTDSSRTVKVYTDNGSGSYPNILLASLQNISGSAAFTGTALSENIHSLRIEVTDCTGNTASLALPDVTVDTVIPELNLVAPRGSSSNWRWITAADDPLLGTIDGSDNFTGMEMTVNSSENIGSIIELIHTSYDYAGNQNYQNDITSSAVIATDTLTVPLPDLENAKHRFQLSVSDTAGNTATIGDGLTDLYEVDTVVPELSFINITEGAEFSVDSNGTMPGFQIDIQMDISSALPSGSYMLTAVPVQDQGGEVDTSRDTKTWNGTVTADGPVVLTAGISKGWWRMSAQIRDDHENTSLTPSAGGIDINIDSPIPSISVRKSFNYELGSGPLLSGGTAEDPAWLLPQDIECEDNLCTTDIEVWTDAPAGSTVYITTSGGSSFSATTTAQSGKSVAVFENTESPVFDLLDGTGELNVRIVDALSNENEEKFYVMIDSTLPAISLSNPLTCAGSQVCRRIDIADDPLTPDVVELAELGYGYADDASAGGSLNFKSSGAIYFDVTGATGGRIEIAPAAGISNRSANILYDSVNDSYYADFSNLTAADSNESGQTDYDLVFTVTEEPSGATVKYLIRLHVDLEKPAITVISGDIAADARDGSVSIDWQCIAGNDSLSAPLPGAVNRYDIRYQTYNDGSCSINSNFKNAKTPLTVIAGAIPEPLVSGELSYEFFVDRINNGKASNDPLFMESDTHQNGNRYCFAIAAIDAVYASDGTVLAENTGEISSQNPGEMKMNWSSIRSDNPKAHLAILRNLGDLDGDGLDDFVIADGYKSSDGITDDYAGHLEIYFTKGDMTFERSGAPDDSLGQGVSSRSDFNGDGFLDFAYTNVVGEVFVHYGSETGLNAVAGTAFTAKDDNYDVFRTMATGDYNGDGCDDIAVSAPSAHGAGTSRGQVYIYFGRGASCSSEEAIAGSDPDVTFEGSTNGDRLGRAEIYAVGDLNADGKTDFAFPTDTKIFIAYGGDSGGAVSAYDLTGFKSVVGLRIGYGNFNGDTYFDLVVADNNKINIYYGGTAGIVATPDITISDISTVNFNYPPSVTNFAKTVSNQMVDINGDGLTDLITVSERGLLIYETHQGTLSAMPSVFDPFVNSTSSYIKVLMLDYGVVYCDNATNKGSCHILNYGE